MESWVSLGDKEGHTNIRSVWVRWVIFNIFFFFNVWKQIERQEKEIEMLREQRKKLAMEQNKGDLAKEVLYAEMGREREAALKRLVKLWNFLWYL